MMSQRYQDYFRNKGDLYADSNFDMQLEEVDKLQMPEQKPVVEKVDWLEKSVNETPLAPQESLETTPGQTASDFNTGNAGMGAAKAAASGGNVADVASAGLMMSGNPVAMGAGLALQTVNTMNKKEQQDKQNRYLAELQKAQARQDAIARLSQIGQGLKA